MNERKLGEGAFEGLPDSKETDQKVVELENLIQEIKDEMELLKKERDSVTDDNRYAKERGLQEEDISWMDKAIEQREDFIKTFEDQKGRFLKASFNIDELNQKARAFLKNAKPKEQA